MKNSSQPLEILVVDDSPGDVGLLETAFQDWKTMNNVSVIEDGDLALRYLRKESPYEMSIQPDLIILDLNLPKKDGRAVLAEIKLDEKIQHIPVIVLSTSSAEKDILQSYRLHANCYITKPIHMDEFFKKVQAIEQFWLSSVELPTRSR